MTTTYQSKIGAELIVPLSILLLGLGGLAMYQRLWLGAGIILIIILLVGNLALTTRYSISGQQLWIKSGLFYSKSIPIESIHTIIETRNPISAPALSLDRLELVYNKYDSVLISPKDKIDFINFLVRIKPSIKICSKH